MANKYEFSTKERTAIYKRDNQRCIMPGCNSSFGLGVAHYVPRSKGGLGIRQNGVILCQLHHTALDSLNIPSHYHIKMYVEYYLTKHYGTIDVEKLKYNKWKGYRYD